MNAATSGTPVLCAKCGAPADVRAELDVHCPYCGADDRLPADELTRALELKRRVANAARTVAQLDGLSSSLARVFEQRGAFVRATGSWLVVFVLVVVYAVAGSWSGIQRAPANLQATLVVEALLGPLWVGGITLGIAVALFVGRVGYRRSVRPLLAARPPRAAGMPLRCRACGGDLTDAPGPLVACAYCRTQNLIASADRTVAADAQAAQARAVSSAAIARTTNLAARMKWTMIVSIVFVYALVIGAAYLAQALMG